MGKKKVMEDFQKFKEKQKKCPRIKARSKVTDKYLKITKGKIYDIENDAPNSTRDDYLILNDEGALVNFPKRNFELLNGGQPISDETQEINTETRQTELPF